MIEDVFEKVPENLYIGKVAYKTFFDHSMSSPELLPPINSDEINRRFFSTKTDIWSLGCMIFNMATGVPPFYLIDHGKKHILYATIKKADW